MGQSKVANLRFGVRIQKNVSRFYVTVNNPALMCMGQTAGNGGDHFKRNCRIDRPVMGRVVKGFAMDKFHYDIKHSINITEVVNGYEIRMIQPCHSLCFCFKG